MPKEEHKPIKWTFDEYIKYDRGQRWYIAVGIISALIILYSILTDNWLFALIIIMIVIIMIINHRNEPRKMTIQLTHQGIQLNERMYTYSDIKNFWIIYQPPQVKTLYIDFKSSLKPPLSIPLEKQNPVHIKAFLRTYLEEDLEQEEEPVSESLARFFKM